MHPEFSVKCYEGKYEFLCQVTCLQFHLPGLKGHACPHNGADGECLVWGEEWQRLISAKRGSKGSEKWGGKGEERREGGEGSGMSMTQSTWLESGWRCNRFTCNLTRYNQGFH